MHRKYFSLSSIEALAPLGFENIESEFSPNKITGQRWWWLEPIIQKESLSQLHW